MINKRENELDGNTKNDSSAVMPRSRFNVRLVERQYLVILDIDRESVCFIFWQHCSNQTTGSHSD